MINNNNNNNNNTSTHTHLGLSDEAQNAATKREHLLRELQVMSLAKTILAPTDDQQVKLQLRSLGHPICYFGEGPGDRRDRLRTLLARIQVERQEQDKQAAQQPQIAIAPDKVRQMNDMTMISQSVKHEEMQQDDDNEEEQEREQEVEELFFTEGPDYLASIRYDIAQFSLARAHKRIQYQKSLMDKIQKQANQPELLENEVKIYRETMDDLKHFDCLSSQAGDHRPLSSVSVVPFKIHDRRLVLSSSWSGHVKIWDMDSWTCMQTYKAHSERIVHTVCNPTQNSNNKDQLSFATASADKTIKVWTVRVTEQAEAATTQQQEQEDRNYNNDDNEMRDEENGEKMEDDEDEEERAARSITRSSSSSITSEHDAANTTIIKCVTLVGHTDRLSRLCYHPSGKYLLSTSFDNTWRFWDLQREVCVYEQEGHAYQTYAIAMHPDGSLCATSDLGGIVRVWDLRIGRTIIPMRAHVKQCLSLDFSPNGYHMATSSDDNTVKIWDLRKCANMDTASANKETAKSMHTIPAHLKLISRVQYEPVHGRFITTASYDGTLKVWDSLDYKPLRTCKGHEGKVMYSDIVPSDLSSATNASGTTPQMISCGYDRTVKLWSKSDEALRMLADL